MRSVLKRSEAPVRGLDARARIRTWDPVIKNHLLHQLSYARVSWSKCAVKHT